MQLPSIDELKRRVGQVASRVVPQPIQSAFNLEKRIIGGAVNLARNGFQQAPSRFQGQSFQTPTPIQQQFQGLGMTQQPAWRNVQPTQPKKEFSFGDMPITQAVKQHSFAPLIDPKNIMASIGNSLDTGLGSGNLNIPGLSMGRVKAVEGALSTLGSKVTPKVTGKVLSNIEPQVDHFPLLSGRTPIAGVNDLPKGNLSKIRGLVSSAKTSENVSTPTKPLIEGSYTQKPNRQLMGEARGLLEDGVRISFKGVKDIDKKVAATIQNALDLSSSGNHEASANLFNNLAEHATELGRGVQAFNMLERMSPEAISLAIAKKINKFNRVNPNKKLPQLSGEQVRIFGDKVKSIVEMPSGREKNFAVNDLMKEINNVIPSTFADKATTVWKAGLLTSLRTTGRNLVGNTISGVSEIAKDLPAVAMDTALSGATGKRTLSMTLRGSIAGTKKGFQGAWDVMKHGYDPEDSISKFDVSHVTWGNNPVEQGLKKYTDFVFRTLGAQDKPFYGAAYARSLYSQAGAEAINAGRRGDKNFIENLVKNATEEMKTIATQDASYATFKNPNFGTKFLPMAKAYIAKEGGQAGKIISEVLIPFTGVPSSIAGQILTYSPVGLAKGLYQGAKVIGGKGELQREASQTFGRGAVGTGVMAAAGYLASKGLISGYPKDPEEARQWQLEGKSPRSIFIGGKWRSIGSIGPQAIVALAAEAGYNAKSKGEFLGTVGKDFLNQTFLGGVQRPLQAIADPSRYGESYLQGQASSVIPNIVKDTAAGFDPLNREVNSIPDAMQRGIPGLRNSLLPQRDVFGKPVKNEGYGLGSWVDVFNSKTPIHSPAIDELSRLNIVGNASTPGKIRETQKVFGKDVKLTPEELDNLEVKSGNVLRPALEQLVKSPGYKTLSDEDKQKMIGNLVSDIRGNVRDTMASGISGNSKSEFSGVDVNAITNKYQQQAFKLNFENSDKTSATFGNRVYRKDADGNVTSISKASYDSQLYTAKMDAARDDKDFKTWFDLAQLKYNSLNEQLKDPSLDELEKAKIEGYIRTLVKDGAKFKKYGGFTKPKTGRKPKAKSIKFKTTLNSFNTKTPTPRSTKSYYKAPKKLTLDLPKIDIRGFKVK